MVKTRAGADPYLAFPDERPRQKHEVGLAAAVEGQAGTGAGVVPAEINGDGVKTGLAKQPHIGLERCTIDAQHIVAQAAGNA